uniref:Thiol:disulfide interchange protein n=1 Tax=Sphondylothamnion multifidum TaxID=193186 RepID=A0A4D6WYH2_9FLOR|nr:Thiol:disulfide interchange protein [Sphondylothamnion multifidum]
MIYNFFESYEVYFYSWQQQWYSLLIVSISHFQLSSVCIVILFGIFTSLTPCFISIIPLSLAYVSSFNKDYMSKNIFILGITSSTLLIMLLINIFNYQYIKYIDSLPVISCLILCFIGLNFLQIIDLFRANTFFTKYLNSWNNSNSIQLYNYLTGCIVGLSALPCSSSIIFIVSFWLLNSINLMLSLTYLFFYSFGYLISMFFIFNIVFNYTKISVIASIWDYFIPISGFMILTISLLNLLEKLFI